MGINIGSGRAWLFLPFLGLVLLLLFLAEGWRSDREQLTRLAAQSSDLERVFRQFAVLPAILASDPRLVGALADADKTANLNANQLLMHAAKRSDAAFAFLMDNNGLTVASSNYLDDVSFIGQNYAFRPYFTNAISGQSASFFAVGATTGIPGYFVSEPVLRGDDVLGVIVVKLEPQQLPESWNDGNAIAVVTDELGVTILSTAPELLYTTTRDLTPLQLGLIETERRYPVAQNSKFRIDADNRWQLISGDKTTSYRVQSQSLNIEPWSLSLLTPSSALKTRALLNFVLVAGLCLVAGLLWQNYRQQVLLAAERAKLTEKLEDLVSEQTKELQDAQQTLIAESNFAMLGRMSAAINHEINQPLASLRLNLATLRQLIENRSKRGEDINSATDLNNADSVASTVIDLDRTAKRITRVIETLRALPHQKQSVFLPVDAVQWLEDSVRVVQLERKSLSRYLSLDLSKLEDQHPLVHGQAVLLQQALLNVLYNALDAVASSPGPYVRIHAFKDQKNLLVEVMDNGPGVDKDAERALFEPFQTGSASFGGMGLGLTLARQILIDHGGSLTYSRRADSASGHQTVFTLLIPLPNEKHE